jgi:hypothetical protein
MPLLAQNACQFGPISITGKVNSPNSYKLSWNPVSDSRSYEVTETVTSADGSLTTTRRATEVPEIQFTHESITDVTYQYRIRAFSSSGACETTTAVKTFGDPVLRRAVRRGIVPVVGSTRGANGAVFKTYLKLEGINLKGRVYFHPVGQPASDSDPSTPYDLVANRRIEWNDIVADLGQSGIGSLSIVPDEGSPLELPTATVRLYNVAENGIFGTNAEMYSGIEFLDHPPAFQHIEVPADGNFRVNVGARAILDGTSKAIAIAADGSEKKVVERTFRAGEMIFGSPEAVYGVSLLPGESLVVTFSRAIIPFYTLTDNRTNDPFLYVQGAERDAFVEAWTK